VNIYVVDSRVVADQRYTLDGKVLNTISSIEDASPITAASIADPYIVIRRADGSVMFFVGDTVARTIRETSIVQDSVRTFSPNMPLLLMPRLRGLCCVKLWRCSVTLQVFTGPLKLLLRIWPNQMLTTSHQIYRRRMDKHLNLNLHQNRSGDCRR